MRSFSITWHDSGSKGFTDLIPLEWFRTAGPQGARTHRVVDRKGRKHTAKCDLSVKERQADLDYERHKAFNTERDMLPGILRLRFGNAARDVITQVLWKGVGDTTFAPGSTTVGISDSAAPSADPADFLGITGREGKKYLATHLVRERRPGLVAKKIASAIAAEGELACEACGFVFSKRYGALGVGFAEVHHRRPLAEGDVVHTSMEDLAILCSNCHRMIHRTGKPMISVEEFSVLVKPA